LPSATSSTKEAQPSKDPCFLEGMQIMLFDGSVGSA